MLLSLRTQNGGQRRLLSASPTRPRAQLTQVARENPQEPPMFCMLLRKHLSGGKLLSIVQPPMERLVEFSFEVTDELGDRCVKRLVLEAMGRHSNLVLLDPEGRILDCIRRVDQDMSAQRQILPGMFYRLPPTQDKLNPLDESGKNWSTALERLQPNRPMEKGLVEVFGGISPLIARELAFETSGTTGALVEGAGQA